MAPAHWSCSSHYVTPPSLLSCAQTPYVLSVYSRARGILMFCPRRLVCRDCLKRGSVQLPQPLLSVRHVCNGERQIPQIRIQLSKCEGQQMLVHWTAWTRENVWRRCKWGYLCLLIFPYIGVRSIWSYFSQDIFILGFSHIPCSCY